MCEICPVSLTRLILKLENEEYEREFLKSHRLIQVSG